MDWINAHRKGLAAVIEAVLLLLLDADAAQAITAAIGTLAVILLPNDQAAIDRVYHRRAARPDHGPPGKPNTSKG